MATRLGILGGAGAAFCGGGAGRAFGCAATAIPLALINVGRVTATGTGRVGGRLMMAPRVGATSGLAMTRARAIICGSTLTADCATGRPDAKSCCRTAVAAVRFT
jgi:hypothetical protein